MCSQIRPTWVILHQLVSRHPTFVIERVVLLTPEILGKKIGKINDFWLPCAKATT